MRQFKNNVTVDFRHAKLYTDDEDKVANIEVALLTLFN